MKCPKCKQSAAFIVTAKINILLTDSGSEHIEGADEYYDSESFCRCFDCDCEGKVKCFTTES